MESPKYFHTDVHWAEVSHANSLLINLEDVVDNILLKAFLKEYNAL